MACHDIARAVDRQVLDNLPRMKPWQQYVTKLKPKHVDAIRKVQEYARTRASEIKEQLQNGRHAENWDINCGQVYHERWELKLAKATPMTNLGLLPSRATVVTAQAKRDAMEQQYEKLHRIGGYTSEQFARWNGRNKHLLPKT